MSKAVSDVVCCILVKRCQSQFVMVCAVQSHCLMNGSGPLNSIRRNNYFLNMTRQHGLFLNWTCEHGDLSDM